ASQLFAIEGARALHMGAIPASGLGVSCPDERTLVVRLDAPTPDFAQMLSYPAWFPVRKDVIEAFGGRWTRPENLVSNGAFRLKEFVPGSRAELVRNDTWRAASTVKLDGVLFRFTTAERNAYDLFQAGEVHWLKGTLTRDMIPTRRRSRPAEFHTDPVLCTYYVSIHTTEPPLDDSRLRWALNLSIDKEKLTGEVLMGGQAPATGLVSPAIAGPTGYQPPTGPGFDAKAAKGLLDEFVRDRGALPKLTYLYNTGEANKLIAEFLQAEWKRHLDLDVAVEATEWKSLLARVQKGDYQLARSSWCADWVDPANFLEVFESGAASNYPAFTNPAYDHELAEARAAKTPAERIEHWRLAEETLIAAQPILPLYYFTRIYLLSTAVMGFESNLLDIHPLELLDIQR
ncbi:MAG: peptide ABC transporter substrate-binding protein, partial [Armatimonadota bacterium]